VTRDPSGAGAELALLRPPMGKTGGQAGVALPGPAAYREFTSQDALGHFLLDQYKIRTPKDLTSCEVCHR
jgi:hypothetical protein